MTIEDEVAAWQKALEAARQTVELLNRRVDGLEARTKKLAADQLEMLGNIALLSSEVLALKAATTRTDA